LRVPLYFSLVDDQDPGQQLDLMPKEIKCHDTGELREVFVDHFAERHRLKGSIERNACGKRIRCEDCFSRKGDLAPDPQPRLGNIDYRAGGICPKRDLPWAMDAPATFDPEKKHEVEREDGEAHEAKGLEDTLRLHFQTYDAEETDDWSTRKLPE
jgi:hypothetical protein